jgi:hypothetical protein
MDYSDLKLHQAQNLFLADRFENLAIFFIFLQTRRQQIFVALTGKVYKNQEGKEKSTCVGFYVSLLLSNKLRYINEHESPSRTFCIKQTEM